MPLIWCWVNRRETNESHLMLILLCLDIIANGSINILASKSTISGSPALLCECDTSGKSWTNAKSIVTIHHFCWACMCVWKAHHLSDSQVFTVEDESVAIIRSIRSHPLGPFTWNMNFHTSFGTQWTIRLKMASHTLHIGCALPKHLCQELYGTNRTAINRNIFYSNKSIVSVHLLRIQSIFMQRTPTHTHTCAALTRFTSESTAGAH